MTAIGACRRQEGFGEHALMSGILRKDAGKKVQTGGAVMDKKKKKKKVSYGKYGYFFIAPFFITYLLFQLWPLINTFYYSTLTYYKRNGREFVDFAGIKNFLNILGMTAGERGYVLSYLKNTLIMWGFNFVPQILVSLLLAVWLTDEKV